MRRNRLTLTLAFTALVATCLFAAGEGCSSTDAHPDAGDLSSSGTSGGGKDASNDNALPVFEGGPGDSGDDGGNNGCNDHIKDNMETDVDCGGPVCKKCVDGQACVAPTDCGGGACINNLCKTVSCSNGILDGDETDVDCGGKSCAHCTIGKHCLAPMDCTSNTCNPAHSCDCPANMAIVAKATGGAYCIDQAEVTKGQYNQFVTANVPVSTQIDICKSNTTFIPRGAWPPATAEDVMPPGQGIAFAFSLPVHYVNWCDAYAYCKWAGKQLCGEINKQGLDTTQRNDAGASAWFNACSAQGSKGWPYGTTFTQGICNDDGVGTQGSGGNSCNAPGIGCSYGVAGAPYQDDGIYTVALADNSGNITMYFHTRCQGGSTGLYQMSGNVAEWEDSCTDGGPGTGPAEPCSLRGGSYTANGDSTTVSCEAARELARMPPAGTPDPLADVGIRCCIF
jgi:formylglycine-generating enzyme required for sulfatase activity